MSDAPTEEARPHYPEGFLWGAALSAHQTEGMFCGGEHSDWYRFEHSVNDQGIPNTASGDTADTAADFWHRYAEDFELARTMGLSSLRTSLAWEKIEPSAGAFSSEAIGHYREIFSSMKAHGLRPVIALHHFVNPQWFNELGGWLSTDAPKQFLRYASFVVGELGDLCDLWVTFNEPVIYLSQGYLQKQAPPLMSGLDNAFEAAFQIARAHRMVAAMIHAKQGLSPGARGPDGELRGVGIANAFSVYDPFNPANPLDRKAAEALAEVSNWAFVRSLFSDRLRVDIPDEVPGSRCFEREFPAEDLPAGAGPLVDWLGVNYYMRWLMEYKPDYRVRAEWHTPEGPRSDNGWIIDPEGLERVLRQSAARFPGIPLVVTENGLADANDTRRPQFIRDHLASLDRALQDGERGGRLDVRGYYHWSLIDNFEWQSGFQYRFGLVEVRFDRGLERAPRPSAGVYRDEIAKRWPPPFG